MKTRWYKSGNKLLKEIQNSSPSSGTVCIWYMGQHGFVINPGGSVFYIDVILNALPGKDGKDLRNYPPPFNPGEVRRVDYYICTHNHADHLNLDTILPLSAANPDTKFIVPAPWTSILVKAGIDKNRVIGAVCGQTVEAGNVKIIPVPAVHTGFIQNDGEKDKNGNYLNLGFIFKAGDLSLYHPGDTWITPKLIDVLKSFGPINAAMLPINGTDWERTANDCVGNINVMDAVKLAMELPIDLVIPCHYDMIPGNTENPAYFVDCFYRYCPEKRFHICSLGEKFIYE